MCAEEGKAGNEASICLLTEFADATSNECDRLSYRAFCWPGKPTTNLGTSHAHWTLLAHLEAVGNLSNIVCFMHFAQ